METATLTLGDILRKLDDPTNGITFARTPDTCVSYAELGSLIRGNARHLAALGVGRGDRVMIAIETDLEHIVALLALIAVGAIPVSVKLRRSSSEEDYRNSLRRLATRYDVRYTYRSLPDLGAKVVTWDPAATTRDDSAFVTTLPSDTCIIQFSSGSLGDPKPVPLRHESLIHNIQAIVGIDRRERSTLCWAFLPLSHDMGLIGGLLTNVMFGNPVYLSTPQDFLRRPLEFLQWSRGRACGVAMPDFALRYLVRFLSGKLRKPEPNLLSGIQSVYCGAEPIGYATISALVDAAPTWGFDPGALIFCYGMAEATLLVTSHRFRSLAESFVEGVGGHQIACVGTPASNTEVVVRASAPDGTGTIFIRGSGVFRGYFDAAPLVDGWHDTGDVGFLRGGDLYISGRVKDIIIVNGENVFPHDIEEFVMRQPGVRDCMVMSERDRFFVVVVPSAQATIQLTDLAAHIGAHFGAVPVGMTVGAAGELQRTTSGKPMRDATLAALRSRMSL